MPNRALTFGAGHIDRVVYDADELLRQFRTDTGCDYLDYQPVTPGDKVVLEDLAVTLLVNSQAASRAVRSLRDFGATIDLHKLADKPLEQTTTQERYSLASQIAHIATWPGFGASLATKVLHKKRPDLIPILDNQAIFGAYMSATWPATPAS